MALSTRRIWWAAAGIAMAAGLQAQEGKCPNLFHSLLGISQADTDRRIAAVYRQLFHGDPRREAVVFPFGEDEAYVADVANHDTRTEGLSYGMMIAVQLGQREDFARIWRFASRHLYQTEGTFAGYFAWHADWKGERLDEGPAPDGEEWFATALLFAASRWNDAEYEASAQQLLHVMIHQHERTGIDASIDMFDRDSHLVVFAPNAEAALFTDPSYQLPEFYAVWARRAWNPADRAFYAQAVQAARQAWRREANPYTGLMPDYATFDGPATPGLHGHGHENFQYDAWRTLAYPSLDWAWWRADHWEPPQADRVLHFLSRVSLEGDRYTLDGRPLSRTYSQGLWAMAAVAGLAAQPDVARPFVRRLWEMPTPEGAYRYYNGMLMLLGMLETGGRFQVYGPQ